MARIRFYCARLPSLRAAASIQQPSQVFNAGARSEPSSLRLWPGLLALALVLNLAELIMRKGKAVFDSFFGKPAAAHA